MPAAECTSEVKKVWAMLSPLHIPLPAERKDGNEAEPRSACERTLKEDVKQIQMEDEDLSKAFWHSPASSLALASKSER